MATRISARHERALPKSMTGSQFEHVMAIAAQLALLMTGLLALALALALGKVILAPISLAIIAGLMFGPVADLMERRSVPPAISAGVVVILFVGILVAAAALFAGPLSEWIARGPVLWDKLRLQLAGLKQPLESIGAVQEQLKALMGSDAAMTVQVQDGGPVTDVALMAPSIAADMLLFLAGLYFFLATRHHIRFSVLSLCYSRRMRWRAAHVFRDVEHKVSRFLMSAAAINLGLGVATSIAMWALGMPSPLLWGALAAVLNFIPYVGQATMLVILLAVGLGTQASWVSILLPVVAYGALNLAADQIVFPHLVGRALTLNPFVIFVSIAFWLWVWGPMGGFVAVPSLLVLQSLILHIFPSTQALPGIVARKVETLTASEPKAAEPPAPPPEKPEAPKAAPVRAKRAARKPAVTASP